MKANRFALFSFSMIVLLLGASFSYKHFSDKEKEELLMKTMMDGFKNYHFNPLKINDDFSNKAFDLYLERLDNRKRFLTAAEIEQLSAYRSSIDEEINGEAEDALFDLSNELIEKGITRARTFYEKLIDVEHDFTIDESIEMDGTKRKFASSEKELEERWRRVLKYELMSRISNKKNKQEEELEKDASERKEDFKELSFDEMVAEARKETKKVFGDWFDRMEKVKRKERLEVYLNTITNIYDPHSGYYSPIEKQNFDIGMSGKLEGIGARLQTEGDATKVTEIITGGPAWKEGSLEPNDLILKVAQGDEEPVDVSGMLINEVVTYIRGKKGTVVNLTVKKKDGSETIISIVRDIVETGEGFAKSLLLDSKGAGIKNVGYIMLPRFYADFNDEDGRHCAEDVAQEIKKLKEQGVEGIILDLRDNGGGSLRDVVKMTGLFIEEGPVVQVKARNFKPRVLEDEDDRVLFDGHLIVMVNQFSASASEILAAAVQDYNRGIIVGSASTFGKGTVQRFVNLDDMVWGNKEQKPLGSVKMTIQKFYRINGGATQLKGVESDIVLPDRYQKIDLGEKEYDYAMEWTQIDPVKYAQKVRKVKNLDKIRANSKKRVSMNETFQMINADAARFERERDETDYSLNLEEFRKEIKEERAEAKRYNEAIDKEVEGLGVRNLPSDIKIQATDEAKAESNEKWISEIKKDIYLQETLHIMKDMMK